MKRLSSFVAVMTVVGVLLLPLSPVLAASFITLNIFSGPPTTLQVTGNGWVPGETVSLYLHATIGTPMATALADTQGSFTASVSIPLNTPEGSVSIIALGSATGDRRINRFYVTPFNPDMHVNGNNTPGSPLGIHGSGFAPNETILLTLHGISIGQSSTDAMGDFSHTTTVPYIDSGTYQFQAIGQLSTARASTYFYVGDFYPSVTPSSFYLLPGNLLQFSGTGFAPQESVRIFEDQQTTPLASATTDAQGNFTDAGNLYIPVSWSQSSRTLRFVGATSNATTNITITIGGFQSLAEPSTYYISGGEQMTFSGNGFLPGETIDVQEGQHSMDLSTITADGQGAFTDSGGFTIPFAWAGSTRRLYLTGASSNATEDFTVTIAAFQPQLSPSTYYVIPGQQFTIAGADFAPHERVTVRMNGAGDAVVTADDSGNFLPVGPFVAPAIGTIHIVGIGENSQIGIGLDLTLGSLYPIVTPSTWYTPAGSHVSFSGTGFLADETVQIILNDVAIGSIITDALGEFTTTPITIPFRSAMADFVFTGARSGATALVPITIAAFYPGIELSTYYNAGGVPLTITGTGFAPQENVAMKFGGRTLGSLQSDMNGAFALHTTVPYAPAGDKIVEAIGESSGASARVTFTEPPVYVNGQLGAYAGAPGDAIQFIGSGYIPGEIIQITTDRTDDTILYTFSADANGMFNNVGFTIPQNFAPGPLLVTMVGNKSFAPVQIVYYVTGG